MVRVRVLVDAGLNAIQRSACLESCVQKLINRVELLMFVLL
jgi:hypothetical protein